MCATAEPGRFQCGPARPGEGSSAAQRVRRSFPKEKAPDFSPEFLEKNPAKMKKNSVLLWCIKTLLILWWAKISIPIIMLSP
jgi:hypothetical protein